MWITLPSAWGSGTHSVTVLSPVLHWLWAQGSLFYPSRITLSITSGLWIPKVQLPFLDFWIKKEIIQLYIKKGCTCFLARDFWQAYTEYFINRDRMKGWAGNSPSSTSSGGHTVGWRELWLWGQPSLRGNNSSAASYLGHHRQVTSLTIVSLSIKWDQKSLPLRIAVRTNETIVSYFKIPASTHLLNAAPHTDQGES